MESLIAVTVVIGDRSYRIKIRPEDEEVVRRTVKTINEKIVEYRAQFSGKDMQDYISMVLIWYATQPKENIALTDELVESLLKIERQLDEVL